MNRLLSERYMLSHVLGEGGFSSVYLATDTRLDRTVAVKILKSTLSESDSMVERFLREAKLTASLKHPNSLRIFDYGQSDDDLYIVSELLEGQPLDKVLQTQGMVDQIWLCEQLIPLCIALQEAHDIGIVHRDLKPSNLFLTVSSGEERIVVIDFGISKGEDTELNKVTKTGQLFGTPHYMSPEQIQKPESVVYSSDLYSLGVIIFELLSGQPPFDGESMFDLLTKHLKDQPPKLSTVAPHCSAKMEELVDRLLSKSASDRPQSAYHVAEVLREVIESTAGQLRTLSKSNLNTNSSVPKKTKQITATLSSSLVTSDQRKSMNAVGFPSQSTEKILFSMNRTKILILVVITVCSVVLAIFSENGSNQQDFTKDDINVKTSVYTIKSKETESATPPQKISDVETHLGTHADQVTTTPQESIHLEQIKHIDHPKEEMIQPKAVRSTSRQSLPGKKRRASKSRSTKKLTKRASSPKSKSSKTRLTKASKLDSRLNLSQPKKIQRTKKAKTAYIKVKKSESKIPSSSSKIKRAKFDRELVKVSKPIQPTVEKIVDQKPSQTKDKNLESNRKDNPSELRKSSPPRPPVGF